jgi:hypothetical protein
MLFQVAEPGKENLSAGPAGGAQTNEEWGSSPFPVPFSSAGFGKLFPQTLRDRLYLGEL